MKLGWYGFELDLDGDWAPAAVNGNRASGYLRLASGGKVGLQLRWEAAKSQPNLQRALEQYSAKLQKDAKRSKHKFTFESESDFRGFAYRYSGAGFGRGRLWWDENTFRTVFLEAISKENESLLAPLRKSFSAFRTTEQDTECWAVLGLCVWLPRGAEVTKRVFVAGRTHLAFKSGRSEFWAERWGLADQLLKKHPLETWAKSVTRLPKAKTVVVSENLVEVLRPKTWFRPAVKALVSVDEAQNQISVVYSEFRESKWEPQWDWLKK